MARLHARASAAEVGRIRRSVSRTLGRRPRGVSGALVLFGLACFALVRCAARGGDSVMDA